MPPLSAYALDVAGSRLLACRSLVGLTGEGAENRSTWIQVAPVGRWEGHPDGAFELTEEGFASCIAAFERQANPPQIDWEHASLYPNGGPVPAAGWIQSLKFVDGWLCALVEFTERAAALIKAGEYRFCSGVFAFDRPDRKSGDVVQCVLDSIGMTNRPFIDGQTPIALSHRPATRVALSQGNHSMITREALLAALEQLDGKEFSEAQLESLIASVAKMAEAMDPKAAASSDSAEDAALKSEPKKDAFEKVEGKGQDEKLDPKKLADLPEAGETDFVAQADAPSESEADAGAMVASKLMEATGMDAAALLAALDANLDAVAAALQGSGPAPMPMTALSHPVIKALSDTLSATKAKLAKYEAAEDASRKRDIDAEVDVLVAAGKVLPAHRETWRGLAHKDIGQFRALAQVLPVVVPTGREASAITPAASAPQSMRDGDVFDLTDPSVIALNTQFDRMGIKDMAIRAKYLRAALGVSAG